MSYEVAPGAVPVELGRRRVLPPVPPPPVPPVPAPWSALPGLSNVAASAFGHRARHRRATSTPTSRPPPTRTPMPTRSRTYAPTRMAARLTGAPAQERSRPAPTHHRRPARTRTSWPGRRVEKLDGDTAQATEVVPPGESALERRRGRHSLQCPPRRSPHLGGSRPWGPRPGPGRRPRRRAAP